MFRGVVVYMVAMLLNCLFISIPEEIYLVFFTLLLMGRFNYRDLRTYIPVIISAVASNLLRYSHIDPVPTMIIPVIVMIVSIQLSFKIKTKELLKLSGFVILSVLTLQIMQLLFIPLVLYTTNTTIDFFNHNIFSSVLITLPERIIQCGIIYYFSKNKINSENVSLLKVITSSRKLLVSFVILVTFNYSWLVIISILVGYRKELIDINTFQQLIIILGNIVVTLFNIHMYLFGVYCMKVKSINDKKLRDKRIKLIKALYTKDGSFDNIDLLNDIEDSLGKWEDS